MVRLTLLAASTSALIATAGCGDPYGGDRVCTTSADCGSDVCTRTHECLPADEVRRVMTHWTLNGQAASAETCTGLAIDHLDIQYSSDVTGEYVHYSPVPCAQGQFLVDVWPVRFNIVQLESYGVDHQPLGMTYQAIAASGDVELTIDIPVRTP